MVQGQDWLERMVGQLVIVDLESPYVCLGRLEDMNERYLVLGDADLHDMRDSDTTRENYIAESVATGIKRNRKRVVLLRNQVVAISLLEDFTDL
ncbi:MAG: hypothetical protein RMJ19_12620 [Gemmatales bacterium]|nr:hypothetical protein [Gemmatales bacterium]MCS7161307.1 hypothetical protein [Gemmatales bacterium]MDW8176510.1 hypothetical protein [Gemmatales bacterium]MDW8223043.1 hypothetical protein [Gemmatales bacterium]